MGQAELEQKAQELARIDLVAMMRGVPSAPEKPTGITVPAPESVLKDIARLRAQLEITTPLEAVRLTKRQAQQIRDVLVKVVRDRYGIK